MSQPIKTAGWQKVYNTDEINSINHHIESLNIDKTKDIPASKADGTITKNISTVTPIPYHLLKHLISGLVKEAYQATNLNFGYTTFEKYGNEMCNFNIYKSSDSYHWHMDGSNSDAFDVKCTLLINLSTEPYKGGEFQLNLGTEIVDIPLMSEPGSAFMFKSYILHRVKPVTSGTRKTLTVFINGPKFQ